MGQGYPGRQHQAGVIDAASAKYSVTPVLRTPRPCSQSLRKLSRARESRAPVNRTFVRDLSAADRPQILAPGAAISAWQIPTKFWQTATKPVRKVSRISLGIGWEIPCPPRPHSVNPEEPPAPPGSHSQSGWVGTAFPRTPPGWSRRGLDPSGVPFSVSGGHSLPHDHPDVNHSDDPKTLERRHGRGV